MGQIDLNLIKGRVAEALVESIFKRARFKMTRFGRESDLRGMLKAGKDETFSPDFLAMREVVDDPQMRGMYETYMIEVKYAGDLSQFLDWQCKHPEESVLVKAREKWPKLWVVFVTDQPVEHRTCFQALDLSAFETGSPFETVELHHVKQFDIFYHNVEQHEELTRKIYGLLSAIRAG